jgi:type IV pilus assembly protein PilO
MAPPAQPAQSALAKIPLAGRVGAGVGLSVLVAFVYWFIFYSDVASKIEGAQRQKQTLNEALATQQQVQATYFADRGELALREQRAKELNKVLPPDTEEDSFLSSVQQASNTAGIDLKGYVPKDEVPQVFYAKIPMSLDVSGRFHQIAKFAYELGKVDRIINVESIELSDPAIVGDEVVLKGKCLATAFHALAPNPVQPAPGSPVPGAAPPATAPAAGGAP